MEAEKLRAILASPPLKLEKTARRVNVPLPVAKQMRIQALNLVQGKCVLCSAPAYMGICVSCRGGDPQNEPANFRDDNLLGFTKDGKPVLRITRERFLRQVDPGGVLIRQYCPSCGHLFSQSVETVVKNLLNYGKPYIAKMCRGCNLKRKKMKALPPVQDSATLEEEPTPAYSFKPFAESTVITEMRSKIGERATRRKRGQKVKKQRRLRG